MSAIKKEVIIVDVTRGDCLEDNRISGKSNTGTYFISSLGDFDKFKAYFRNEDVFVINLKKIIEYQVLFNNLFKCKMCDYYGKGLKFDDYCNYLISLNKNPLVEVTLRINDSRVFMRFKDNTNPIVNSFRNLLYENLSFICIERVNDTNEIYPLINTKAISKDIVVTSDGLELDE